MLQPAAITGEKGAISVWLDGTSNNSLKAFHCTVCGKVVFEYYSAVKIVMAGDNEGAPRQTPIVIQCHGQVESYANGYKKALPCKTKYFLSA